MPNHPFVPQTDGSIPCKVLVVDDDRALRQHARLVLGSIGIAVTEVGSGRAAINALHNDAFDAVLLDVHMPGIDGFETCRELRALAEDSFLPILMLTGLNDAASINQAYASGATDFSTKPVNWGLLKQRLLWLIKNRQMAEGLLDSEYLCQALLDMVPDSILRLDQHGRLLHSNKLHGCECIGELAIGQDVIADLPAAASGQARLAMRQLSLGSKSQAFVFASEAADEARHFEARMVLAGKTDVVLMLRNVTERVRAEAEIRRLAYYDQLTGLPNLNFLRNEVTDAVERAAHENAEVVALRLELFGLEQARAILGLAKAEQLLQEAANGLQADLTSLLDSDDSGLRVTLARASENGFALLMEGQAAARHVDQVATRLIDAQRCAQVRGPYEINMNAAIGAAVYPLDDPDGALLLDKADLAIRHADKQDQPVVTRYSSSTWRRYCEQAELVKALRAAIENAELQLVYQPKVSARDGRMLGVEALVRWNRNGQGPVSPATFIPLAEENGLILPLSHSVLHLACRQQRQWAQNRVGALSVAVNISAHQFSRRDFIDDLRRFVGTYNIRAGGLQVELTESVVMSDLDSMRTTIKDLAALGVGTAIDDFGTGFSSLGRLRELPFDSLKIDKSFIDTLTQDGGSESVVDAIVTMGHALNMQVVAEGVENQAQLDCLRNLGCDVIQGYYTGRPMSSTAIETLLQSRTAGVSAGD